MTRTFTTKIIKTEQPQSLRAICELIANDIKKGSLNNGKQKHSQSA